MSKASSVCMCGCGKTATADFLPGHDQRLRVKLENAVGGLLYLEVLVDAALKYIADHERGHDSSEDFLYTVRCIFHDK